MVGVMSKVTVGMVIEVLDLIARAQCADPAASARAVGGAGRVLVSSCGDADGSTRSCSVRGVFLLLRSTRGLWGLPWQRVGTVHGCLILT